MNLYWMLRQNPEVEEFAWCSHSGAWSEPDICSGCGKSLGRKLQAPFLVEWERGSTHLGDFTACGSYFLVNERAKDWLELQSSSCTFTHPHFQRSKYKKKTLQIGETPPLWWVSNEAFVHLDVEASKLVESDRSCSVRKHFDFKYSELVIRLPALDNHKCFHIYEFGASRQWFCTQEFADAAMEARMTNIRFEKAGIIV